MNDNKIKGLIAAPYTAFDSEGNLNIDMISSYASYLKQINVSGVFVNGTTGEGTSLTIEERMITAEEWIKNRDEQFKVLIHVGHDSLQTAQQLASHAQKQGADGIGAMAPPFMKTKSLTDLVHFNQQIAASADQLAFYYYHIPSMTGANYEMIDFLNEAHDRIPNLAGIKFTYENLMDMKLCIEFENNRYTILHGRDEILLAGLALGVEGAIGSTYNYLAPLFHRILQSFEEGDLNKADTLQYKAIELIQVLIEYGGGIRAGKSIMKLVGLDLGKPRLPNVALSAQEEDSLYAALNQLNFEEYSLKYTDS